MRTSVYTTYPGISPLEQAKAYLADTQGPSFARLSADAQTRLARNVVLAEQTRRERVFMMGGSSDTAAGGGDTPTGGASSLLSRLRSKFAGEDFANELDAALAEDPGGAVELFQKLAGDVAKLAKRKKGAPKSPEAVAASARLAEIHGYPGPNNVAKAIAMLSDKRPGFKAHSWADQCRIAGNYLATGRTE